jgi:hypothetical protein
MIFSNSESQVAGTCRRMSHALSGWRIIIKTSNSSIDWRIIIVRHHYPQKMERSGLLYSLTQNGRTLSFKDKVVELYYFIWVKVQISTTRIVQFELAFDTSQTVIFKRLFPFFINRGPHIEEWLRLSSYETLINLPKHFELFYLCILELSVIVLLALYYVNTTDYICVQS